MSPEAAACQRRPGDRDALGQRPFAVGTAVHQQVPGHDVALDADVDGQVRQAAG